MQAFEAIIRDGQPCLEITLNGPLKSDLQSEFKLKKKITSKLNLLNAEGQLICYESTDEGTIKWYLGINLSSVINGHLL